MAKNKNKHIDILIREMNQEQKKRDADRRVEIKRLDKIRKYKKNHGISILEELTSVQLQEALNGRRFKHRPKKKRTKRTRQKQRKQETFYNSKEWRELRYQALKLHGRRCLCCGQKAPNVQLHVDHIKPRSKFPELEFDINNLQILCKDCNLGKSNKDSIDYRIK